MFVISNLVIKILENSPYKDDKNNSPTPSFGSYFHSNGFSPKDLEVKYLISETY